MKTFALLAGLTSAQLTIDSYSADGVTVSWKARDGEDGATLSYAVGNANATVIDPATSPQLVQGASESDIFRMIDVVTTVGGVVGAVHHLHDVPTGAASVVGVAMQDLGNVDGGLKNNGTLIELLVKPDRTDDSKCYNEVAVTFVCDGLADPVMVGGGNSNDTMALYNAASKTMKIGFSESFDAPALKLAYQVDLDSACFTGLGLNSTQGLDDFNGASAMSIATGGISLIKPMFQPIELILEEVEYSRVENYPDVDEPLPVPHANNPNSTNKPNSNASLEPTYFKTNSTMVLYHAEIPESEEVPICASSLTVEFTAGCVTQQVTLYGMSEPTMALGDGQSDDTLKLANKFINEVAILVVYSGASVQGTCDVAAQKPKISMTYPRWEDPATVVF